MQAYAQEPSAALRACAAEKDDARRLACYDKEVARTPPPRQSATAVVESETPAPTQPDDKFGYRGTIAREELDRQAADEGANRLEATIAKISSRPLGQLVITLDNGQVWSQKMAESIRVKVGDRIVIKKAAFGSFLLVAPNNSATRVTRER